MIRRLAVLAGALVAAASISSCTTFERSDDVAVVEGQGLSNDEFASLASSDAVYQALTVQAVPSDPADGDASRQIVSWWVVLEVVDHNGHLDDVDSAAAEQLLDSAIPTWRDGDAASTAMLTRLAKFAVLQQAGSAALDDLDAELLAADVWVSSRIGTWNGEQVGVVPLGQG